MKVLTFFMNILYFVNGNVEEAISSIATGLHKISSCTETVPVKQTHKSSVF